MYQKEKIHSNTEKMNMVLTALRDWDNAFGNKNKMPYQSVSSILLVLI